MTRKLKFLIEAKTITYAFLIDHRRDPYFPDSRRESMTNISHHLQFWLRIRKVAQGSYQIAQELLYLSRCRRSSPEGSKDDYKYKFPVSSKNFQ